MEYVRVAGDERVHVARAGAAVALCSSALPDAERSPERAAGPALCVDCDWRAQRAGLIAPRVTEVAADLLDRITVGDSRELLRRLPDASVDLLFTDPIYERLEDYVWLAGEARRVLKPGRPALIFYSTKLLPETLDAVRLGGLTYKWNVVHLVSARSGNYGETGPACYMGMLLCVNGPREAFTPEPRLFDVCWTNGARDWHIWRKNLRECCRWVHSCSRTGDLVLDPFAGGGTMLAAAAQMGRRYVGFEINPATAALATERLRLLPPHFELFDDEDDEAQAALSLDEPVPARGEGGEG